ncbi:hypothetical protein CMUS01_10549 [Colletotrichum musicola]|uniref:Uncharacterized protein n=1 Tax=Colletotrichum musicola TaxID=2175873 RepID=A0A8H6K274_9PEZI|nr:hypothetical protein CMUS01_10549 [Colletotrichum musicola]
MGFPLWRSPSEEASEPAQNDQPMSSRPAVVLDLQGILIDHHYSRKCVVHAILRAFNHPNLHQHSHRSVAFFLETAIRRARGEYDRNEITQEEAARKVVNLFSRDVGLPEPDEDQVNAFYNVYNPARYNTRMPTPGSIELLVRLREWDVKVALVAEYQRGSGVEATDKRNWGRLVDAIVTREVDGPASQAGCPKHPDVRMFQEAVDELGVSAENTTVVLGGDCNCYENHNGAFAATFGSTRGHVYDNPFYRSNGETTSLSKLLRSFEGEKPAFVPYDPHPPADASLVTGEISWNGNTVTFVRPQMDLITEARLNIWLGKDMVRKLAKHMAGVLKDMVRKLAKHMAGVLKDMEAARFASAIPRLEEMLIIISGATYKKGKDRIDVRYYLHPGDPEPHSAYIPNLDSTYRITEREHSMLVEFGTRTFEEPPAAPGSAGVDMDLVLRRLYFCCGHLEQGSPRKAMELLTSVMYTTAAISRLQITVSIDGEC